MVALSLAHLSTALGIDVGGSGIKAALVDTASGELTTDRFRLDTPQPATPDAVLGTVAKLLQQFDADVPIGMGFPAVVRDGIVETAMNIDSSWIDVDLASATSDRLGREVALLNDADAAAVAEARFGAAAGVDGLVAVITFGTGIGSGLLLDGVLATNTELGVLELDGHAPAEDHFAASARKREGLSWVEWGQRANRFLIHVNRVLNPSLIVVGGGVTKRWEQFVEELHPSLPLRPALLRNNAGIVGAALWARSG